jgi:D-threonate/D-erythronate kinase
MTRLFIIADDLTGALDTGVKFAINGSDTRVIIDMNYDLSKSDASVKVLIMDIGTRHLAPDIAYDTVYNVVKRAITAGIPFIYKKTDSALRGNVGSELTAALKASGKKLIPFLPALPTMGRTTIGGIQYIEGIPVHKSVFGKDPFEPVRYSYIPDIIKQQSEVHVHVINLCEYTELQKVNGICVFDSETDLDLYLIAMELKRRGLLTVMAGCAGLAGVLPEVLEMKGKMAPVPSLRRPLLVFSGSVNEITKRQLAYAENHGFKRITLTPEQKLEQLFFDTAKGRQLIHSLSAMCVEGSSLIIDTNDVNKSETIDYARKHDISLEQVRVRITKTLGKILKELVNTGLEATVLITGGDTLVGFIHELECREITPLYEIEPGVVYSEFQYHRKTLKILSKSGGFGDKQLIVKLWKKMK